MEKNIMKIIRLKIDKLYDRINYNIKFNDSLTFLYGDNGCGKTTVLNILTSIITGRVYELFKYKFKSIILDYVSVNDNRHDKITIMYNEDGNISLNFLNEVTVLERQYCTHVRNTEEREDVERVYFLEYPCLKKIFDTFKYAYLPLNRNDAVVTDRYDLRNRRSNNSNYIHTSNEFNRNKDMNLVDVQRLVANAYNKENFILKRISEKFSDDILRSFLDVEDIPDIDEVIDYMNKLSEKRIREIQIDYTAVLKTINKWDAETEIRINTFFDSLIIDIDLAKRNIKDVSLTILFKVSEIIKMTRIIKKAEKTERTKNEIKEPIVNFLKTVNDFICCDFNGKEIYIDDYGTLYLKTMYDKKITVDNLSSGEKQIITFFAYLIFGLETTKQSIFIVDEPELSLHLNWQKKFIDAILSINQNVQLIFATHAPEIIGRHRDKAIKLIPRV